MGAEKADCGCAPRIKKHNENRAFRKSGWVCERHNPDLEFFARNAGGGNRNSLLDIEHDCVTVPAQWGRQGNEKEGMARDFISSSGFSSGHIWSPLFWRKFISSAT
jgi:hypothetical protein